MHAHLRHTHILHTQKHSNLILFTVPLVITSSDVWINVSLFEEIQVMITYKVSNSSFMVLLYTHVVINLLQVWYNNFVRVHCHCTAKIIGGMKLH